MLGNEFHPIQQSRRLNESPSPAGVVVKFYALLMPLTVCDNLSDSLCSCIARNHVLTPSWKARNLFVSCPHGSSFCPLVPNFGCVHS